MKLSGSSCSLVLLCMLLASCTAKSEIAGSFASPAQLGSGIIRYDEPDRRYKMVLTVSEVLSGKEAEQLARDALGADTYQPPGNKNEYLAVNVHFDVERGPDGEVVPLYPCWHVALRTSENGEDFACQNCREKVAQANPPFQADAWLYFLVPKGSRPVLYFQPYRNFSLEEYRTSGAFFSLTPP